MKKLISSALCAAMALSLAVTAFAAEPMLISPGPEVIAPAPEEDPVVLGLAIEIDGRPVDARACVMVPLRAVAEKLGFTVIWDNGTVTVTGSERYIQLTIGRDEYFAAPTQEGMAGASLFSLGCAPYAANGTTYVPVELFDALLGCREGTVTIEGGTVKIDTDPEDMGDVQIPDPFVDHATLEEAARAAGFELTAPDTVSGSDGRVFRTIENDLLEVIYRRGEDETARVRKVPGSQDVSGDYNVYPQTGTVSVDGREVTMRGSGDKVSLAVWTDSGYSYAVSAAEGISRSDMTALVSAIR